jgi:hypothetical protein
MRWLCKWEQECDAKLLTTSERRRGYYFKFNVGALLRADTKTTMESLGIAITHRIINPNEAREKLDMNPYEEGDEFFNPAITPGSGAEEDTEDDQEDDSEEQDQSAQTNLLAAEEMIRSLITREANDVVNGTNRKNFVAWVDGYYPKWEQKFADKLEAIGMDRDLAREHCKESILELLELSGVSTQETLKENVEKAVKGWPNRVVRFLGDKDED